MRNYLKWILGVAILLFVFYVSKNHLVQKTDGTYINFNSFPKDKLLTIAHRGVPFYAPEHTIPSYELAKEFGADYIELDLQMTKDGVLVAVHDQDLLRTANSPSSVNDLTLKEIKLLDVSH